MYNIYYIIIYIIYIYIYIYIDFLLRRLIIKCVCYSPELVLFKTFPNLVRHDNSRREQKKLQTKNRNVAKKAPTRTPAHAKMSL